MSTQSFQVNGQPQDISLSNLQGHERLQIGFNWFPTVRISERNIDLLELQKTAVRQQQTQILEANLSQIKRANQELVDSLTAETDLNLVYESKLKKYNFGMETLKNVLDVRRDATNARIQRIKVNAHLDLLRVTLNRAMIADDFTSIQGCNAKTPDGKKGFGPWLWIKSLFSTSDQDKSIDRMCHSG